MKIDWAANRETAVNTIGGGYRVYYTVNSSSSLASQSSITVPYVSGLTAPLSTTLTGLGAGIYYVRVVAYSSLNPIGQTGGSTSAPSTAVSIKVP